MAKLQDTGFEILSEVVMKSSGPLLLAGFLLGLFFDPEYVGDIFLRNVGSCSTDHMALYTKR
jgi:hypothetical protein